MIFDLFHSIGRVDSVLPRLNDRQVFGQFLAQTRAADQFGFGTIWVAESHFSSEIQKQLSDAVIPNYQGEVGLNADSPQLAHIVFNATKSIGFGTAIYNIVGGNGGPIAAADRIRTLAFLNSLSDNPRELNIGIASGRFPYINRPFGIVPRDEEERSYWPQYLRFILAEATEIFLRLCNGEAISSADITGYKIKTNTDEIPYRARWIFDRLGLVPSLPNSSNIRFVLGSACETARKAALKYADCDIFNLSFTPPEQLNRTHSEMFERYRDQGRVWHRSRMPRTVLIFIDRNYHQAQERAEACFETYIEAMRGTVTLPPKSDLMARALIGDASMIREQLSPGDPHGFHPDDRLMCWFEFNQPNSEAVLSQMRLFAEEVIPYYSIHRSKT